MRLTIAILAVAALSASCVTADKQAQSSAYEVCKSRTDPDARARCIDAEKARFRAERAAGDAACLASIEEQRERAAMIDGQLVPTARTKPASAC